ncbi:MAG: hypothetical protein KatS3mg010_1252 [Acidimicrobiia bacterium]|nr:MAG: hypothetical protein KatS3mg010_1252 [Acidimicrobiia bacterium]
MTPGARRVTRRASRGFTLVEMCTAIVVMGLVIAPIAIAVSQAITLVPEAKTRTDRAMETTFLVDRFANDVADSNISPGVVGGGADTITCGEHYPAVWFFPANLWYLSATDWRLDGLDDIILYTGHWTDVGGGVTKVELKRTHLWLTEPERTTWYEAQLTGYCRTGGRRPRTLRRDRARDDHREPEALGAADARRSAAHDRPQGRGAPHALTRPRRGHPIARSRPSHACSRNHRFMTFPLGLRGSSSTISTYAGTL